MTPEAITALGKDVIWMILLVSGPSLAVGMVVGVIISILQAVTQIREMTLTFVPKIVAVGAVILLTLPWTLNTLIDYTKRIFEMIPAIR